MNLIGDDQLFEVDALLPEGVGEGDGLVKVDVAIVVSMNQQDRRAPGAYASYRGGFEGGACRVFPRGGRGGGNRGGRCGSAAACAPIVNTVEVHARGEKRGIARESERREIAPVRPAPQPDMRRIHVGTRAQVQAGSFHVMEFARAAG